MNILDRNRIPGLVVELLVVILGVAIALMADSWREDWLESREEDRYLQRLARDLHRGVEVLTREREIFSKVQESAQVLSETITTGARLDDDDFVVSLYVQAGQHGVARAEMEHDLTFQELIQSGRLGLISDSNLRERLIAYYRESGWLISELQTLAPANRPFIRATGLFPAEFGEYGAVLTPVQRENLAAVVRDDPELLGMLRLLHGELVFLDRLFARLIPLARELAQSIESELD